jgi:hypothetical protein
LSIFVISVLILYISLTFIHYISLITIFKDLFSYFVLEK